MFHILGHPRPIVVFLEHGIRLLNTKVAGKSTTMEFLDKELSKPTLGYA